MSREPLYISRSDYERICASAQADVTASDAYLATQKARKEACQKRVSTWGNTLEASRNSKLQAKANKEAALEKERQAIDAQEEKVRASLRQKAIDRANKLIREQDDLVKRFRGVQGVSDMLEIQKQQVAGKSIEIDRAKRREEYFHKQMLKDRARAMERQQREDEERERKMAKVALIQKEQLKLQIDRNLARLLQEKKEGVETVAMAKAALEKERQEKQEKLRREKHHQLEMVKSNEELLKYRAKQRQLEEEQEAQIKRHAADKEVILEKRKIHIAEKHERKQKEIQRMIDRAVSHLEQMKNQEDTRLERAVQEREKKEDDARQAKAERRRREMAAIDASRKDQLARKAELAQAEREADAAMAKEWKAHNKKMIAKEIGKEQKIAQRNLDAARMHLNQAAAARALKQKLKVEEKAYYNNQFQQETEKAKEFDKFVLGEMSRYAKSGKNTKALARALRTDNGLQSAF